MDAKEVLSRYIDIVMKHQFTTIKICNLLQRFFQKAIDTNEIIISKIEKIGGTNAR